jgi:hypothetical protein
MFIDNVIEDLKAKRNYLDELIQRAEKLKEAILGSGMITGNISGAGLGEQVDALAECLPPNLNKVLYMQRTSLGSIVATLIKDKPAKTGEILAMLESNGRKVGGKRPMVTLYSALSRSQFVKRLSNKTWRSLLP